MNKFPPTLTLPRSALYHMVQGEGGGYEEMERMEGKAFLVWQGHPNSR